uniref:Uma2 family endonuclease n=1 Tax=Okeania sp. SIO2F4 TaxID=2607790 RepID=UPI0026010DBD|nr:Uma2 family endonuclease [Okeania sp. SIO2F4]
MTAQSKNKLITSQQYLEWQEKQMIKYEYINGQVFDMTGGTIPHNYIAVNLITVLKNHLWGKVKYQWQMLNLEFLKADFFIILM